MSLDSQDFEGAITFMQSLNRLEMPRTGRQLAAKVHSYWASLKGDRIAPGHARLRVAGSMLSNLLSMEVRDMPGTIFSEPENRRTFMDTV